MKELSLEQIIEKIHSGETNAKDVHNYFLQRIKKYDPKVNSFLQTQEYDNNKEF